MAKPRYISPPEVMRILSVYKETSNVTETCRQTELSSKVVYRILRQHHIKIVAPWVGRSRFSLEAENEMLRRYQQGESPSKLAREYGCQLSTLHRIRERHGVSIMPNGNRRFFSESNKAEMKMLWKDGHSLTFIANHFKVSTGCMRTNLREMGLVLESRFKKGEEAPQWKGGRPKQSNGYFYCYVYRDDPLAVMRNRAGYVLEHRLVMARHLNRPLTKHETVHHVNNNRSDNRIENLQLRNGRHGKGAVLQCAKCGSHDIQAIPIK